MNGFFTFVFSIFVGYLTFLILSHPKRKKSKIPNIGVWNIDILPNIRIHIGKRTYHFHHWLLLIGFIASTLVIFEGIQYLAAAKGLAIGGILQGLTYPDRFKIRQPRIKREARYPIPRVYKKVRSAYIKLQVIKDKIY